MREGEKYLRIRVWFFGKWLDLVAFPNPKHKDNSKEPHFRSEGVLVWVSEKKAKRESVPVEEVKDVKGNVKPDVNDWFG